MERDEAEELLARKLSEEPADEADEEEAGARAAKRLPPKWEIRIQANVDPIVEETIAYRHLAREVDGRYDDVKTGVANSDSAAKADGVRMDSGKTDGVSTDSVAKTNSPKTDGSKQISKEEEHSE